MKSFKQFIAEALPGETPPEPEPYQPMPWDEDYTDDPFWFPWMNDDPDWWPDDEDNPVPSDKYPDPTEPIDLPDPGSQYPWDFDADGDGIPDYQDPDPFDPTNPSYTNPNDPHHDPDLDDDSWIDRIFT